MALQRVLVLGAESDIGSRVTQALTDSGWAEPHAVSSTALRLPASLAPLLQEVDAVVNCFGGNDLGRLPGRAQALYRAAGRARTPRIVQLSAMAVYGPSATGEIPETAPLRSERDAQAAALVAVEQEAARYPRCVRLRPGCVYGPGARQWSGRIARWLQTRRLGDLGPHGDGYCNLVFIDDLVQAVLIALRAPDVEGEAFNLATREPPTWNEYFLRYARALGAVPTRRVAPTWLRLETQLFAAPLRAGEALGRALRLQRWAPPPPISERLLRLWRQEIRLCPGKAESLLGLRWKPLDDGLRETAQWYRQRRP